ncbi:hypothetical protein [Eudoraea chungangensis]|uniref:hypothetical protein n=1 Tax=Eudoraea chungangensis TaxID=1481905 RepID=UPI0023EDC7D8|nr:hypothetical protein [Eudoraea chungangensis]
MKKKLENLENQIGQLLLVVLIVLLFVSCSSSDEGKGDPELTPLAVSDCVENGALGNIELNHGHELSISKEDIIAAKEKTYNIQGFSEHNHTITISSADFSELKKPTRLRVVDIYSSTFEDHRHSVIIFCSP